MVSEGWHLDKKVPIGIIIAILGQTVLFVWWVSQEDARLNAALAQNIVQDQRLGDIERDAQSQRVAEAEVKAQIAAIKETLDQMRQDQREATGLLRQLLTTPKP